MTPSQINPTEVADKEELDIKKRRILLLKKCMGKNIWDIGKLLLEIREKKLYLVECPLFEEYVEKELDFGRTSAYQFMRIAEEFDVQALEHWGSTKLQLFLTLKVADRERYMEKFTPLTSSRDIARQINEDKGWKDPGIVGEGFKSPLKEEEEISEKDYKLFFDFEQLEKKADLSIDALRADLFELSHLFEKAEKLPSFKQFVRYKVLIGLQRDIKNKTKALGDIWKIAQGRKR